MKFSITANRLVSHLQAVMGAVPSTSTLPVALHVLIRAQGNRITLMGTDLHLSLTATRPADIERAGELCTPAKKLFDVCKALPALCEVRLEEKDGKLELRANRSRFSLSTLPAAEFPSMDDAAMPVEVEVTQPQLQRLLKKTSHAIAAKDVRYYLMGVCLDLRDGQLNAAASDGHRMAVARSQVGNRHDSQSCIVPKRTAAVLEGLLTNAEAPVTLRMGSTQLAVDLPFGEDGLLQFSSRLIDAKFPDYERIIPKSNNRTLLVHREEMASAVNRIGLMANKHGGIQLSMTPNYLSLKTWNEDSEEATDGVDAEYQAPDLEIGFCFSYLLDALKTITSPQAVIAFGDAKAACRITDPNDDGVTFVVMPMLL